MKRLALVLATLTFAACIDFEDSLSACRASGRCPPVDAGAGDAGAGDAGTTDAGTTDAGLGDAGANDAGANDAGANDAGADDAGVADAGADAGADDAGVFTQSAHCVNGVCFESPFPTGASWNYLYPVNADEAWVSSSFGVLGHYRAGRFDFSSAGDRLAMCGAPTNAGLWSVDDGNIITEPGGAQFSLQTPYLQCIDLVLSGSRLFLLTSRQNAGNDDGIVFEYLGSGAVVRRGAIAEPTQWYQRGADGGAYLITSQNVYRVVLDDSLPDGGVFEQIPAFAGTSWDDPAWVDSQGRAWLSDRTSLVRRSPDGGSQAVVSQVSALAGIGTTAWGIRNGGNGFVAFACNAPDQTCNQNIPTGTGSIFSFGHAGGAVWASGGGGSLQRGTSTTTGLVELVPGERGVVRDLVMNPDAGGWAMAGDGVLLRRRGGRWSVATTTTLSAEGRFSRVPSGQLFFGGKTNGGSAFIGVVNESTPGIAAATTVSDGGLVGPLRLSGEMLLDAQRRLLQWNPGVSRWEQIDVAPPGLPTAFHARRTASGLEAWLGSADPIDGGARVSRRNPDGGWDLVLMGTRFPPNDITSTTSGDVWVLDGDGDHIVHVGTMLELVVESPYSNSNAFRLVPLGDGGLVVPTLSGFCEVQPNQSSVLKCLTTALPVTYTLSGATLGAELFLGGANGAVLHR